MYCWTQKLLLIVNKNLELETLYLGFHLLTPIQHLVVTSGYIVRLVNIQIISLDNLVY